MGPQHFWYGGWWGFPMMMPILMLVILLIAYLVFRRGGYGPPCGGGAGNYYSHGREPESAVEILKKRYARGEITKDEFNQMKKDLED
ncbi:MAG: SHOCT domain-containing protein [Desulfurivibrio sp.]|nr:SHOCT domain-containing protein [Desulfurivibrio sp.]